MIERLARREVTRPAKRNWLRWKESVGEGCLSRSPIAPAASPCGPSRTSRRKISRRVSWASAPSAAITSDFFISSITLEIYSSGLRRRGVVDCDSGVTDYGLQGGDSLTGSFARRSPRFALDNSIILEVSKVNDHSSDGRGRARARLRGGRRGLHRLALINQHEKLDSILEFEKRAAQRICALSRITRSGRLSDAPVDQLRPRRPCHGH